MMHRTPSLRELRCDLPENVVILPTAPSARVQQPCNKKGRAARDAMREEHRESFPYKMPGVREAEKRAAAILEVDNEPGVILAHAVLAELDEQTRLKVIGRLAGTARHSRAHRQTFEVANSTVLNFGQQWDLMNALAALRGQDNA